MVKSSHEIAVERSDDEMIERMRDTELATYYRLGKKITVSHRLTGTWLCHTCGWPHNYAKDEVKGCAHIIRVQRYAAENPVEAAA